RSYPLSQYLELKKLSAFSDVMATSPGNVLLTGEFAPESLTGVRLTGNALNFLGVPPVAGRTIQPSDIRPGGEPEPVVMLSFQLWQRLFGGDPNAIGKTLRLDDRLHTIIGVMPPRFGWWTSDGVWLPMGMDSRDQRGVFPIARLKPGVSPSVAGQQLHAVQLQLAKENPSAFPKDNFDTLLTNYLDVTVASGEMRTSLQVLFGAVGFLLLIACANVANLQLARGSSRAREMAIRVSVGAGRGRLVRQLLTESVVLSLAGGVLGLLCAVWMTRLIVALMPDFFVPNEARITINGYVLLFSLIVSVLTGILFGLAPALHSSRPDLTDALKDAGRGSGASVHGGRTRALLVVAEVALAVVLLVSAGLTIRSFIALQQVDLGFQTDHVLMVGVPLPPKRYATLEQRNRFARELVERAKNLPGVMAVTIGNGGMPFGGPQSTFGIDGQPESETRRITLHLVGADYLRTLGIPLVRGRMLAEREIDDMDPVVVINEAATGLWPAGEDPVGKRIRLDELKQAGGSVLSPTNSSPYATVVGVIGNTRNAGLRDETRPVALVPYTLLAPPQRTLAFRSQGDPKVLLNPLRAQVSEMDKEQPLGRPTTIEEMLGRQTVQPRFIMALFSLFASLGLALAAAGIYSVLTYLVTRRTHEIGVRMALGAQRADVLGMVFKAGGRLVGAGVGIGILAGFGAARFLGSRLELFQVSMADPLAFLGVVVMLSAIAMVACYVPARRATRVDPMEALRHE
ncbi:MAG TPA: ABC transporter permease, partial [Verrucomicrobiae bacterium]|nr:ABC transporter permease [Verrucomicrobiae bacterium]